MLRITVKSLRARKRRVLATLAAVVLGVAFLAGTLVLTDTVEATLADLYADGVEGTDVLVRADAAFPSYRGPQRPRLDADLVGEVAAVEGVAAAEGRVQGYAQLLDPLRRAVRPAGGHAPDLASSAGRAPDLTYGAAWSDDPRLNPFRLVDGRAPGADDEVVIDRRSARVAGYDVGDRATVVVPAGSRTVTVVGVAAFGRADTAGGGAYVFFAPDVASALVAAPGMVDAIAVAAAPGVGEDELRDRLVAALPGELEVLTGSQLVREGREGAAAITRAVGSFLVTFAVIALFVAAFIIHNTFTILVAQRGREVALLRAVGASRAQVLASVVVESLLVGAAGSVLGVLGGVGVAAGLKALLDVFGFDIPAGDLVVTGRAVLIAGVAGIGVTVASAILPARRAARVPPVAALRAVALDGSGGSVRRLAVGVLVVAAGGAVLLLAITGGDGEVLALGLGAALVFLGVAALGPVIANPLIRVLGLPLAYAGMTGTVAVENAARNPRRTSGAASALMIGVGLVSFITIFAASAMAWLEERPEEPSGSGTAGPTIVIDPAANGVARVSPDLAHRVAELPEVAEVAQLRLGIAEVDGDADRDLVAVEPARAGLVGLDVVEGDLSDLDDDGIAVEQGVARARGLAVGDDLTVRFADSGVRVLEVAAVYRASPGGPSGPLPLGSYLVALPLYEASVAEQLDVRLVVRPAAGVSQSDARRAIEPLTAAYGIPTLHQPSLSGPVPDAAADQTVDMVYALLGLAVLIALLGIANTLSLSVVERTRELGLLRTVGMSQAQVRASVRLESVLVALLGASLGVGVGLFLAWTMVQAIPGEVDVQLRVPIAELVAVASISVVAAVVAAIPAARRASRLDLLAALAAE